jgi:hypothetical protein
LILKDNEFNKLTIPLPYSFTQTISITRARGLSVKVRERAARGQYGHPRKPEHFFMGQQFASDHWSHCTVIFTTFEEWHTADRLLKRSTGCHWWLGRRNNLTRPP